MSVESDIGPNFPEDAPAIAEVLMQNEDVPWRDKSLARVSEKMFWRNDDTGNPSP